MIIGRSLFCVKEAFLNLDEKTCKVVLRVNEGKTKIIVSRWKRHIQHQQYYVLGDYCFEAVSSSQRLGSS